MRQDGKWNTWRSLPDAEDRELRYCEVRGRYHTLARLEDGLVVLRLDIRYAHDTQNTILVPPPDGGGDVLLRVADGRHYSFPVLQAGERTLRAAWG